MKRILEEIKKITVEEAKYTKMFVEEGLEEDDAEMILVYLKKSNSINRVLYAEIEKAKNELLKKGD